MSALLLTDVRLRGAAAGVDVACRDGRITAVGPGLAPEPDAVVLDGGGRAVLPGLAEPHLHLDKALLEDREPGDGTLAGAVAVTGRLKAGFTAADVRERAEAVLRRARDHGTTAVRTPVDVDPAVGLTSLDVLLELRERWAPTVALEVVAFPQEGIAARPGTRELLVEAMRRGADVLGACSYAEADVDGCREHVRWCLELADRLGVPLDVHADFATGPEDPRHDLAAEIAAMTATLGLGGRVTLGHVTTLAGLGPERARHTADALAGAGVAVVLLPGTDLYLAAGSAPLRLLDAAGVTVGVSTNNVRNAFTPFGTADVLDAALLLGHSQGLGAPADLDRLLDLVTSTAIVGAGRGVAPGCRADLVVLDATDHRAGLLDRAPRAVVVAGGEVVAGPVGGGRWAGSR